VTIISPGGGFTAAHVPFSRTQLDRSIPEVFADQVRARPEQIAVRSVAGELTYMELDRASNRVCQAILAHGDPPGRPVAFVVEAGISPIVVILGILRSGNIYTPLEPDLPEVRLRQILDDSGARLIVTDEQNRAGLDRLGISSSRVINFDRLDSRHDGQRPPRPPRADQPCSLLYTSGSSGAPKGVLQIHRNLLHCVLRYTNGCKLSSDDRFLLLASPSFAASVPDLFASLLNGATLLCYSIREGSFNELAEWIQRQGATIYHSVPSLFRQFAAGLSVRAPFTSVRLILLGGETVLSTDVELF
jgi:non-ribosomal peptide synthetase component F